MAALRTSWAAKGASFGPKAFNCDPVTVTIMEKGGRVGKVNSRDEWKQLPDIQRGVS